METKYEVDHDEWDAACMKALEALHNNTKRIGENARRAPKDTEKVA